MSSRLQTAIDNLNRFPSRRACAKHYFVSETSLRRACGKTGPTPEAPPVNTEHKKPRVSVRADGGEYKIVAIGDIHDAPNLPDKSRLKWIARHVGTTRPDRVVQIGDFASFDSCSNHEPMGSKSRSMRPSLKNDLDSLEVACHAYDKELGDDRPRHDITEGNHEHRVALYENAHPEMESGIVSQLQSIWARYKWQSHPYGEYIFVAGVGFTHVPFNLMGKPYGGKNTENSIANDAMFSVVYGHTN